MEIGPVDLSRRRQVVRRVSIEGARAVGMRQIQQSAPVVVRELLLPLRGRRRIVDRLVTREHAAAHEGIRACVDAVLEVAVQKTLGDAAVERLHQPVDATHFDQAPHLAARREPQRDRRDHAEEAVAADRELEQLAVFGAAAATQRAGRVDQVERLDVADKRRHLQTAAVRIGRQRPPIVSRSAPVCFCAMPHCRARPLLPLDQRRDQRGPFDAGVDQDRAAFGVERAD